MKVFSLYHLDQYIASFATREDAVEFGMEIRCFNGWDCNIIQEYLTRTPFPTHNPSLSYSTVPDTMIDPTKPNHVNYWIGTKAELAQGHRRKDLDVV